jgi:hypothetical protein
MERVIAKPDLPAVISRRQAKSARKKRYFTGIPCKNGHLSERSVKTTNCYQCAKLWQANYNAKPENTELLKARRQQTYVKSKAKPDRIANRAYYQAQTVERRRAYGREYYKKKMADPVKRDQIRAKALERLKRDPQKQIQKLKLARLSKYKLSQDDYDHLMTKQDGKCLICGTRFDALPKGQCQIDHDHATGKVRGLLCAMCNRGLGSFRDNEKLLAQALIYLVRHNTGFSMLTTRSP